MSEQDKTSAECTDRGSPMVVVETGSNKYMGPFKPTEKQDEAAPDLHQKCAPAVASLSENWKDSVEMLDTKDLKETEYDIESERHKHVAKKLSSQIDTKKREYHSPVAIPMTPIETESKIGELKITPTTTWKGKPSVTPIPDVDKIEESPKRDDEDSITSEITELRTPEVVKKTPDWSDEEEAGGLPRSESRASRVTRAVRQLFCCGVQLEAPSEDNMSSPRSGFFNSGI